PEQPKQTAEPGPEDVGRRHGERRLHEGRHALQHRLVFGVALGIARAELPDLSAVQRRIGPEQQAATIPVGRERGRIARQLLEAVVAQAEFADDLLSEEAVDVGRRRYLEPGKGLFRDARASDDGPPLEHADREPGAREIARRHQPVVAGPDYDRIARAHRRPPPIAALRHRRRAPRVARTIDAERTTRFPWRASGRGARTGTRSAIATKFPWHPTCIFRARDTASHCADERGRQPDVTTGEKRMTPATLIPDSAATRQLPASIDKRPSMSMWAIVLAGGEGVRLRPL